MALSLYKHNQYGTLSDEQVDSNWSQIESDVNGLSSRLPLNNYAATTDPTVNDDVTQGYSNGSLWYNRTTDTAFVLTNASSGAANWVERDSISAADLGSAAFADILGTVSESGGTPTGDLFERGSNANGTYEKYAGGTMVCNHVITVDAPSTADGSGYRSDAATTWTFPSTFISTPFADGSDISAGRTWVSAFVNSASLASFRAFRFSSAGATVDLEVFAIGRWY